MRTPGPSSRAGSLGEEADEQAEGAADSRARMQTGKGRGYGGAAMLKLIGAALVLLSGALFGYFQAGQLAARPRQLNDLIRALQRLETEIVYGFTPLPEALERIGAASPDPVGQLFRSAAAKLAESRGRPVHQIWQDTLSQGWRHTAMKLPEREALRQLGFTLGLSDREDQAKHLKLCMLQLEAEERLARDEQGKYERMWRSLGLLLGALVVILMY